MSAAKGVLSDLSSQLESIQGKGNDVSTTGQVGQPNSLVSNVAGSSSPIVYGAPGLSPSPPTNPKHVTTGASTAAVSSIQHPKNFISMRQGGKVIGSDSAMMLGFTSSTNLRVVGPTSIAPHPPPPPPPTKPNHNHASSDVAGSSSSAASPVQTAGNTNAPACESIIRVDMPPLDFSHLGDSAKSSGARVTTPGEGQAVPAPLGGENSAPPFGSGGSASCPFGVPGVPDDLSTGRPTHLPYGDTSVEEPRCSAEGSKAPQAPQEISVKTSIVNSAAAVKKTTSTHSVRANTTSKLNTSHRSSAAPAAPPGQLTARKPSGGVIGCVKKTSTSSSASAAGTTTTKSQSKTLGNASTSCGSLTGRKLSSSFPSSSNGSPIGYFQCRGTSGSSSGKVWSQAGVNSVHSSASTGSRAGTARGGGRLSPGSSDVHKLALHKEQRRREIYAWNEKLRKELEKGDVTVDAV